jgi:hypothetical protein
MITTVTDHVRSVLMRGIGLRPVLRYARTSPVTVVRIDHSVHPLHPTDYAVTFYFADGAQSVVRFADWRVALTFVLARRSWSVERVRFAHADLFEAAITLPEVAQLRARGTAVAGPFVPTVV